MVLDQQEFSMPKKNYMNPLYLKIESLIERCDNMKYKASKLNIDNEKAKNIIEKINEIESELACLKRLEPPMVDYDPYEEDEQAFSDYEMDDNY